MKKCSTCHVQKPLDEFFRDNRRPNGRMARCKPCKMAATRKYCKEVGYDRKRYWKDPLKERERHLIKKYGVTAADYDRMFSEQSGKCAVCGKTQERSFDVDHCHGSGRVRGLLCTSCNRMIGHAGDNPESLIRAALYLDPQAAAAFIVSFREAMTASGVQVAA